jgi:hypothetical protein
VNPATRDAPLFRRLERALAASRTDRTASGVLLAGITPLFETADPPRYTVRIDGRAPRDEILASLDRLFGRNARRWTRARRVRPGYRPQPAEFRGRILSFDPLTARTALRRELRALLQTSGLTQRSRFRAGESARYHRVVAYIANERRASHRDPTRQQIVMLLRCSEEQARRALEHARRLLSRYGLSGKDAALQHMAACERCKDGLPCRLRDRRIDQIEAKET